MATSKGSLLNAKDVVDMLGLPWPYQGFGPGRIPTPMPVGYRRARRGTIEAKVRPLDAARSAHCRPSARSQLGMTSLTPARRSCGGEGDAAWPWSSER